MLCFNGSDTTWKGATVATPMSWWKSCCTLLLFATFFLSGEFIDPFTTVYNTGNSPWHLGDFTSIPINTQKNIGGFALGSNIHVTSA